MGLYGLIEACILFVNSLAVLHEERFLQKVGWGSDQNMGGFGEEPGVKQQIINLLKAVRTVARIPLIFVNILTVVCLLLFGWIFIVEIFYFAKQLFLLLPTFLDVKFVDLKNKTLTVSWLDLRFVKWFVEMLSFHVEDFHN